MRTLKTTYTPRQRLQESREDFLRGMATGYALARYEQVHLYDDPTPVPGRLGLDDATRRGNVIISDTLEPNVSAARRQAVRTLARTDGSIAVLLYLHAQGGTELDKLQTQVELSETDVIRVLARLLADHLVSVDCDAVQLSRDGKDVAQRLSEKADRTVE